MIRILFLFLMGSLLMTCTPKIEKEFITTLAPIPQEYDNSGTLPGTSRPKNICRHPSSYTPDLEHLEFTPLKIIKCNVHIMRSSDGSQNFPNKEMGRAFVKEMLQATNHKLENNSKMFLPLHNDTPVLPMCYQFELTPRPNDPSDDGIYFHHDDELFFINNRGKRPNIYRKEVYQKYGIQKDTVMNIFVMGFHPDSIASPTYRLSSNGIAFGKWVKIASPYYFMKDTTWHTGKEIEFKDKWHAQRLLNHELGHCFGLRHTWRGNDGCDDTPTHPNCWNYTKNGSKCDSIISNNIMDYSAHVGAWTPCQIGIIHKTFSNKNSRIRNLVKKTWCKLDPTKNITISSGEHFQWNGSKDLSGHIIIKNEASLTIRCRLSLPAGAKIIVEPGGKLVLNGATIENDCGDEWKGIEIWKSGDLKGEVLMVNDAKIVNAEHEIAVAVD